MINLTALAAALAMAQISPNPAPANPAVNGTWKMDISIMDSPASETCTLKVDGTRLRGICKSPESEAELLGDVDGSEVSWKHKVILFDTALVYSYRGKLENDHSMSGSMMVEEIGTGAPFTAKKEEPPKP
jgi:hypothetical protein